jgi:mono/diheme cytochrome c family protein
MNRSIIPSLLLCVGLSGCGQGQEAADVSAGQALFDQNCAVCHGPGGDVRRAAQHDANTPDLRTIAARAPHGRMPRVMLAEIIDGRRIVQAHDSRTMPIWGEQLDSENSGSVDEKIEALVTYIESIQTD